jgi:hypothetical protein
VAAVGCVAGAAGAAAASVATVEPPEPPPLEQPAPTITMKKGSESSPSVPVLT